MANLVACPRQMKQTIGTKPVTRFLLTKKVTSTEERILLPHPKLVLNCRILN